MRANGLTEETLPFTILTDWAAIARCRVHLSFVFYFVVCGGCLNGEAQPSHSFIQAPAIVPKMF